MGLLDDRLAVANAYWDRWIAGTERRAPLWFADEPENVPNALPSFDHAFEALMHTPYPALTERLAAIFDHGPDLPPAAPDLDPGHGEARFWWWTASEKTARGRGAAGQVDHALDVARHAIAHFQRQGRVVWGEEPVDPAEDTWLFHRDSRTFWNALRHTVEQEQLRNDGWTPDHSRAVPQLHACLAQGYAPWALLNHRSTWWWRPHGHPEHTAEHHRAESALALSAWVWALENNGPTPSLAGVSQALSDLTRPGGWTWAGAIPWIDRLDRLGWEWGLNHDGQDPRGHWLTVGRTQKVAVAQQSEHEARLRAWEGGLLRRGLPSPFSDEPRSRPRL